MSEKIELVDVVRQLRRELMEATRHADGEDLRFALGPVELELTVAVEKAGGAGAKLRFWVVDANTEAKLSNVATQRLMLVLTPRMAGAKDNRVMIDGSTEFRER